MELIRLDTDIRFILFSQHCAALFLKYKFPAIRSGNDLNHLLRLHSHILYCLCIQVNLMLSSLRTKKSHIQHFYPYFLQPFSNFFLHPNINQNAVLKFFCRTFNDLRKQIHLHRTSLPVFYKPVRPEHILFCFMKDLYERALELWRHHTFFL